VKKITITILLFAGAMACGGGSTNLLLGKWKVNAAPGVPAPSPYCQSPIEFGPTTRTMPDAKGKPASIPVTYVTGSTTVFPTVVYVMTDAGIAFHTTYRFLSKDKMILDTALQCPYIRN
jgi:hypothetical protein